MNKIRMGLIGCGGMGSKGHAEGLLALSDRLEVTAVCDIDQDRARAASERLGAAFTAIDYRDLLDRVDAVLIALPHDLHFEVGLACLEAGKHVLMEKPLCNTEEQCLRLIEEAERRRLVLMSAYPVRFWPIVRKMKELIDAKTYGDVFHLSIWTEQFTRFPSGHWTESAERLGGGQLFSHGCHYIDLMLWLLGRPVKGFHLGTNFGTPWMEKEGTSDLAIEFESGAVGYHFGTWGARGTRLGYSIHAHCTEGMLEYNRAEGKLYLHSNIAAEQADLDTTSRTRILMEDNAAGKKTQYETEHFIDCIRTGKRPVTDGASSLQGLRVIWRLYEAERSGTIADLRGLAIEEGVYG
ncbi:Gfo/Idh/MocA family protein [Paenibacillus flagellatus]|nr:Gfo/Idh/MocA family oxidoreductase [Paenibacillus flagellatus]